MKKQHNPIFAFILLFLAQISIAQVNTDLRPQVKSPEVNKFEQYMNMPVNLVSGTPQVNIPIYTLEYGGMTLPISLEYDAGGVKVESIASCVGQNWSLNVGGVVSRIVKSAPDEGVVSNPLSALNVDGYYKDYGLTKLDTELANFSPLIGDRFIQFNKWLVDVNLGLKDGQPDLFYFSTPEGGSKFVFNEQRQVVYLENTDFIINEDFVPNYFRTWLAKSPKGNKYKFGLSTGTNFGLNNAIEKNYTNQSANEIVFDNNFTVNSWFLTEISNYTNPNIIQLEYTDNNYSNTIVNKPTVYGTTCTPQRIPNSCDLGNGIPGYIGFATNTVISNLLNHTVSKLISKIRAGKTEINFIYSNRDDLKAESGITPKKLDEIQVTTINPTTLIAECVKKFKFNYTTVQTSVTNYSIDITDLKRLQLNSVTEMSCNEQSVKPYTFIYNATQLPSKLSFAQDKWGYYNGKSTNPSLCPTYGITINPLLYADRNVDITYAKAGSLEEIIYPTKGTVNFEYGSHKTEIPVDYYYDTNNTSLPPLLNTTSTQSTTGVYSSAFSYNEISTETLLLQAELYYNPTNGAGCGSSIDVAASIIDNITNTTIAQINYQGITTSKTILLPIDKNLLVNQRQYTLVVKGYGGANGINFMCNICSATIRRIPIVPIYDVGGLRIENIVHKNYDNTIIKKTSYTYFQPNIVSDPKLIYKVPWDTRSSLILYNFFNVVPGNADQFYQIYVDESTRLGLNTGYYYYYSTGTDPLDINFIGPNISYVKVDETDNNGIIEHYFNRYKSYFELNNFSFNGVPALPKFQSILAGEKQKIITYNTAGSIVKQNVFDYNYSTTNSTVKGIVTKIRRDIGNGINVILVDTYTIQGQTKTLKTETETTKLNGQDITTTTDYQYNGVNHFMPTQTTTTNSKGEILSTKTVYPSDAPTTEPLMADLILQNRKIPIKSETFNGATKLSEQHIQFAKDPTTNNFVLPKANYAAKFPNALPAILNIGNLEKKITYDLYDTNGTLLQYTPDSGTPTTIIWGYNKTLPIAKIENATYTSITPSLITAAQTASDTGTEASLLTALTALRTTLPNAMVTTYTHKPLIGVSTITDAKGDKITYEYDAFGRLQFVKDAQNNILSENEYHYKN